MKPIKTYFPKLSDVQEAAKTLHGVSVLTPLTINENLSNRFKAKISLKREDLQEVRSYKIRGAYNKIASLTLAEKRKGIVCASAGNHAQGVAYSCFKLGIDGVIFMPKPTPHQKIKQVKMFGGEKIEIQFVGDTFDDAQHAALEYTKENDLTFVHPFDDQKVIEGQGTIGLEILDQISQPIDYLFLPIGGGGLAAGVSAVFKVLSSSTKIIGVEPAGAPSMQTSLRNGVNTPLDKIEKFVDGAAVKKVGDLTFEICKELLDDVITVPEGKVCNTIVELYNKEAIVVEPAGALTITALDQYKRQIKGKNVVCVVSGSNNDISRMEEIKERALLYNGLKHYFVVHFPQRAGALKEFVNYVLGENDDIVFFEFAKKNNREMGPAVVGIQLTRRSDLKPLITRMKKLEFYGDYLNRKREYLELLL